MISKRIILILILLLLFLGAVYASQKRVKLPIYEGTLHPENIDKYGTSSFIELLRSYGFNVFVGGTKDLLNGGYGLYILIGPDVKISPGEAKEILAYVMGGGNALIASEFDDIETILKLFEIYPSNLINYLNPDNLKDPFIEVSCSVCQSFNTMELDLPNSFIIAATHDEVNREFTIINQGDDYMTYRYSSELITFTATATGRIVDLNDEFKSPISRGLFGETTTIRNLLYTVDILRYTVLSGNNVEDIAIFTDEFTMIFVELEEGGRIVFLSDTSPFINFYLEGGKTTPLINDILGFLQPENENILVDVNHYDIIEASIRLPHLGRIILESLHTYLKEFEREYASIFSDNTLLLMGTISLVGLSMFTSLRRYLRIRDEAQLAGEDVTERDIIISTDTLIPMNDIYGKNFKEFVINTYNFTSLLIYELFSASIEDILERKIEVDEELYESVRYISSIYNKIRRKIVFPPIFNKRSIVRKLLKSLDTILSRGGVKR